MRIDEAREQVAAGGVDGLGLLGGVERSRRAQLGDLAAPDQHVLGLVDPGPRIEHVGAAQQQVGAGLWTDEQAPFSRWVSAAHAATAISWGPTRSS